MRREKKVPPRTAQARKIALVQAQADRAMKLLCAETYRSLCAERRATRLEGEIFRARAEAGDRLARALSTAPTYRAAIERALAEKVGEYAHHVRAALEKAEARINAEHRMDTSPRRTEITLEVRIPEKVLLLSFIPPVLVG